MYYWANLFSPGINGSSKTGGRYSSGGPELNLECLQHVYKMSSSVALSRKQSHYCSVIYHEVWDP